MRGKRYIKLVACVIISTFTIVGCGKLNSKSEEGGDSPMIKDNTALPIATIVVKDFGTMEAELYPSIAPNTVNNFIELANKGYYDNLTFHRIIKDFMIQGGDPQGTGIGGAGYSIKGEFSSNGFENDLKHELGVLSMARASSPDSAGSQFFIMTGTTKSLDGKYAAFGKVISGLDVLEKIGSVKTGDNDKPIEKVTIESIKVDTKGVKYESPKTIK